MGWWKKLKAWQKGGLLIGGGHFIFYNVILLLGFILAPQGESGLGFLLIFLEWPWVWFLTKLGIGPLVLGPTIFIDLVVRGILGSVIYGFLAMLLIWGLRKKPLK